MQKDNTTTPTTSNPRRKTKGTLILVCCHAIFTGPHYNLSTTTTQQQQQQLNPLDETHWLLAPFQQSRHDGKESEHFTFLRHITTGLRLLLETLRGAKPSPSSSEAETETERGADETVHLIFSGGATKRVFSGCDVTEADGYVAALCRLLDRENVESVREELIRAKTTTTTTMVTRGTASALLDDLRSVKSLLQNKDGDGTEDGKVQGRDRYRDSYAKTMLTNHVHAERHATDSFQNILFGLFLYRRITNTWPRRIVVVTHAFKTARVQDLHARALKLAGDTLEVRGVDPPFASEEEREETVKGEMVRGYGAFEADLYGGRKGGMLGEKRRERGWSVEEETNMLAEYMVGLWPGEREVVENLMKWDGGENGKDVFPQVLPWETQ